MRWIFVGASTIASQYMLGAVRAQGDEVVWVVSGSADHGRIWAEAHGVARATTDLADALADASCDAVYVSSTNEKHLPQAMAAIAAGKHVLCEKPLAMTVSDAVGMVRAADEAGVTFATNHHLRCSGTHQAVRNLIAGGRIGTVLSLRIFHAVHLPPHLQGWRINDAAAGGGVIPDITVHDADVTRFLLGEDPKTVVAQMGASGMGDGVEDSAMSVWTMPSGAMVMSHESFTHPYSGSGLEVHGTEGSIFAQGVMTQEPVGDVELVTAEGRVDVEVSRHSLYEHGVAAFCAAVKGEGRPAADGVDGIKSLAVAMAVRDAAAQGAAVDVDYGGVA
ncbi:Gfo/Idh/MocA family protein [Shimia marina]|uniref:1,5-anhydro-D-fructose reductase n=1 Tax=Shimia marina TaxID=321267 RepID=A0A0P1EP80_9RHOB|nr:Gfo/Idh/MocA family oxidoreductase [Shimia marina]CUH52035.1 1,5-anhydro-D-fructose reductase [Shimia marina]SFE61505.1 1,5-anhydro-D-fructose reductase (1,5-anhydro-D-mannitol-forming) [Shimia marina]